MKSKLIEAINSNIEQVNVGNHLGQDDYIPMVRLQYIIDEMSEEEEGQASILIELKDGNITVKHGTDQSILLELENVQDGSWDKIWELLRSLR